MTVFDFLEHSARRVPDKVAFADEHSSVTYAEVLNRAKRIGTALAGMLRVENEPVAVMIDRNVESICAFLGVVASRNFYVPIDAGLPLQRIGTILKQMRPAAIITIDGNLPAGVPEADGVPTPEYRELVEHEADEALIAEIRRGCRDIDPLYAICTSGSSGVPKGVLTSHRCVLDFVPVFADTFGFTENDIFGNQAPFDFDASVKDIYSTLLRGATTFIIPRRCFAMPKLLVETLDERGVSVIVWTVSALCIAAQMNAFRLRVPRSVKKVLFSGEVMPIKMLNIWREALPDAMFVNLYGPTEATCNCMYYIVDRQFADGDMLPLGVPFDNEGIFLLDENNRPIAPGQTGELCVCGSTLALGYYRDPERTAAAFVQNPLNDRWAERVYRTGDLVRLETNGEYKFVGRKDFQIKHMGHRIELGEIESAMNALDGIDRTCCQFDAEREKIVSFYVGTLEKAEIFTKLKAVIPKYMIPHVFLRMEEFPLTHNGKVDRKKLMEAYRNG